MRRAIKYYRIIWLKHDLRAGLAVFLVALPLCLGIALASGAPLYAGVVSGIIGGIIVSVFSGSNLAVSGPAAGLTTVVAASIVGLGDYRYFLVAVVIAGAFQILLGLLRMGSLSNYFPSSVIKGMLAAIGIILISKQIPIALGYDQPNFWTSGFLQLFYQDNFLLSFQNFNHSLGRGTIIITLFSLGILILSSRYKHHAWNVLPAPLLVVTFGIIADLLLPHSVGTFVLKDTQLVSIPNNVFKDIIFPDFSVFFSNSQVWLDGITIGLLASLETLLCIEAIDKLDRRNRITPVNRELWAQGIGNVLCGLFGAIPITAVVVRGAANVDAGAKTWLSSFTHGLLLLLSVAMIPFVLNLIPYASLAAILLVTGYNLTRPRLYIQIWKLGWKQFIPFILTIVFILVSDLLIGVSIGLLVSIYFIVQDNFRVDFQISKSYMKDKEIRVIKLNATVNFLNKVKLRKALDDVPRNSRLIIDGSDSEFVDYDILEIIAEYKQKARDRNIELELRNVKEVSILESH
jgi:MFS superfamily sulfate permease-like transporter